MLFTSSEEFGITKGLNILNGKVKSLKSLKTKKIIPNLGWNTLNYKKKKSIFYLINLIKPRFILYILIM
jgi:glutamine amidotransferase